MPFIVLIGLLFLLFVPFHTFLKLDPRPAKAVQRASNRQVHLAQTNFLHLFQVVYCPAASGIRDWYGAPL